MNKEHYDTLMQGAKVWNDWRRENPGVTPDLRDANLAGAYLYGTNLRGAYLYGANLTGAYLYGTNLRGAYLYGANLTGAYLRNASLAGADLRNASLAGADLTGANLYACIGDGRYIKYLQTDRWQVTYTATHMQIGCQGHSLVEWWGFSDEEIERMSSGALDWWMKWKPVLRKIIELSPAEPTTQEEE